MITSIDNFEERYKANENRKWITWCLFGLTCVIGGVILYKIGAVAWVT
jgi:hypothetical protein